MRTVKASAKTREEAIQKALGELGVEMYEVDKIEIVDEGSKGIFGFGARPVEVSVSVDNLPDEPRRDRDGGERRERSGGRRGGRGRGSRSEEQRSEAPRGERKPREKSDSQERKDRKPRGDRQEQPKAKQDGERPPREGRRGRSGRGRGGRDERQDTPKAESKREDARQQAQISAKEETVDSETFTAIPPDAVEEDFNATITDEQGMEAAALLEEIIAKMDLTGAVEFARTEDGSSRLNVTSEDGAILIGRKGRNLSAMQYLINRIISRSDTAENTERLVVDVEGYVDRRRATLEDMARNFAEKAKSTGRNMRLKPLSPQERRIIHLTLENDPDLRTYSLGAVSYTHLRAHET